MLHCRVSTPTPLPLHDYLIFYLFKAFFVLLKVLVIFVSSHGSITILPSPALFPRGWISRTIPRRLRGSQAAGWIGSTETPVGPRKAEEEAPGRSLPLLALQTANVSGVCLSLQDSCCQLLPAAASCSNPHLFLASCGPAFSPLDHALGVPPPYLLPEKSLSIPKPALRLCHYFPADTFLCRRACTSGESGREAPGSVS